MKGEKMKISVKETKERKKTKTGVVE